MTDNELLTDFDSKLCLEACAAAINICVERLREALPYSSQFVTVTVRDGRPALQGTLEWNYQRDTMEETVRATLGGIGISNDIVLKPFVAASDIRREIAETLRGSVGLGAKRISVDGVGSKDAPRGGVRTWAQPTEAETAIS